MLYVRLWLGAALLVGCGFGDNIGAESSGACGDGVTTTDEGCDDGNQVGGDGCSETCAIETNTPICGNGAKEEGEDCDDGNSASGDGCSSSCQPESPAACSVLPQGGCSGAMPACDLTEPGEATTSCRAVTATGTSDNRCSAVTECSAGYTCVGDLGSDASCMPFCISDADCSGLGSRCVLELEDDDGMSLGMQVCSNACDPYLQVGCPEELGCLVFDSTGGDYTACLTMGNNSDGEVCSSPLDCKPGSVCVGSSDGMARCASYCKLGPANTCAGFQECLPFAASFTLDSTSYGFCR